MRVAISTKLIFLVIASVSIATAAALVTSYITVGEGFKRELMPNIQTAQHVVQDRILRLKEDYIKVGSSLSIRQDVVDDVVSENSAVLQRIGQDIIKSGQTDFVVFTDSKGKVIARGHDNSSGDSIAKQECVIKALSGEKCATFEPGSVVKISLRTAVPVMKDGSVVGVVVVGMNISKDDVFVDSVKKLLDVETTIFWGDRRESTTIVTDGKRAVGSVINNKEVLERVLTRGEPHFMEIRLFERPYLAAYWPITDSNAKPVGMFFIGRDMSAAGEARLEVFQSIFTVCICVLLAMIILGYLASKIFTRPILSLVEYARLVAGGEYSKSLSLTVNDEIGDLAGALNTMVAAIREKIIEAQDAVRMADTESANAREAMEQAEAAKTRAEASRAEGMLHAAEQLEGIVEIVSSASEELSAQVEQSSLGSEEQSHRVGETATAMEEMNATVLEVARNASQAAETADKAKNKAQDGALVVTQVVKGMGEVQASALELKTNMTALGTQAEGIGHILNVISDIADQTNLLALNAAIEAARAGDAGRGFAVVADEVRKLAEKTMTATRQVSEAIHGIQDSARKNSENVERAVARIDTATGLAGESGAALQEIVALVDSNTDQVRSIATAAEQQSATSDEINRSLVDVNRISSQTSQGMKQSAQAVGELAHQAQVLKKLIDQMKDEGGASASAQQRALQ